MEFMFPDHHGRFNRFIEMDSTHKTDLERQALFYLIACCRELAEWVDSVYDFEERSIRPEAFEEIDLTSKTRALLELAFNLI
ncbi:DUF6075 family protein [Paenibacillus polymyxa]|uniref:DUF6075 family protein n=1 Tax=Paenibacillus polymyxa TaxID=1406 RepID=UPI00201940A2|nr:DUF6075 family protein [Paenibacillus polymyxa]UQQ36163.1 DUF6075 family protein [Paenibacillus polymyxa]